MGDGYAHRETIGLESEEIVFSSVFERKNCPDKIFSQFCLNSVNSGGGCVGN